MNFVRSHGLYYISIDAPEDISIVPSFIKATGDQVYIRFHGKNRDNWFKRNITAAERFRYLYSERKLNSLAKGLSILETGGVKTRVCDLQELLSEFRNHERNYDGRGPS